MPDKPLEGQGAGEDISILRGEGTEEGEDGRGGREGKGRVIMKIGEGGKGESDYEDRGGRGCREVTGIGSLHWFLV